MGRVCIELEPRRAEANQMVFVIKPDRLSQTSASQPNSTGHRDAPWRSGGHRVRAATSRVAPGGTLPVDTCACVGDESTLRAPRLGTESGSSLQKENGWRAPTLRPKTKLLTGDTSTLAGALRVSRRLRVSVRSGLEATLPRKPHVTSQLVVARSATGRAGFVERGAWIPMRA